MKFHGHTICNLDSKSRIVLPSKIRKNIKSEANNKLILTRGMDKCILVYPQDEWDTMIASLVKYNVFNAEERYFVRQFMKYVNEVELDSQNRILIPAQLMEYSNIRKEVLVLGMLDKIELWDPATMDLYDGEQKEPYESVAQKVTEKILSKRININLQ